jgi:hypothetical protein
MRRMPLSVRRIGGNGPFFIGATKPGPAFYELLRCRGNPVFYVFDLLWLDGKDLRERPLIERKRILRSIMP